VIGSSLLRAVHFAIVWNGSAVREKALKMEGCLSQWKSDAWDWEPLATKDSLW